MKVLLGHLDCGLGTKGQHSDLVDIPFLGLYIVSNISTWPNLLLKVLSLAPVLLNPFDHFNLIKK